MNFGEDIVLVRKLWCAGQSGFGIRTAPAATKLAASLLLGKGPEAIIAEIDATPYLAERFAT